jgi:hypothetical protein
MRESESLFDVVLDQIVAPMPRKDACEGVTDERKDHEGMRGAQPLDRDTEHASREGVETLPGVPAA